MEVSYMYSAPHSRHWFVAPGKRTLFLWLLLATVTCFVLVPVQLMPVLSKHAYAMRMQQSEHSISDKFTNRSYSSDFSLHLLSDVIAQHQRNDQQNPASLASSRMTTMLRSTTTATATTTRPPKPTVIARVPARQGLEFEPRFLLHAQPCSVTVDVIICVHSNPTHGDMRQTVRQTWANQKHWPDHVVRTVFFVGRVDGENASVVEAALKVENRQYGDVIQADFVDTYRNLTLKAVSALHWVTLNCNNTTYMVKTDDDVVINTFSIQKTLLSNISDDRLIQHQIACCTFKHYPVLRTGKWAVTSSEMSDGDYPTYCAGMAYATLTTTVIALRAAVREEPFFWIDDVYVTGYLAQRINATFRTVAVAWTPQKTMERLHGRNWRVFFFFHARSDSAVRRAWRKLFSIGTADTKTTEAGVIISKPAPRPFKKMTRN